MIIRKHEGIWYYGRRVADVAPGGLYYCGDHENPDECNLHTIKGSVPAKAYGRRVPLFPCVQVTQERLDKASSWLGYKVEPKADRPVESASIPFICCEHGTLVSKASDILGLACQPGWELKRVEPVVRYWQWNDRRKSGNLDYCKTVDGTIVAQVNGDVEVTEAGSGTIGQAVVKPLWHEITEAEYLAAITKPTSINQATSDALEASITKWKGYLVEGQVPRNGDRVSSCPLCRLFHAMYLGNGVPAKDTCKGCPVYKRTGEVYCYGSPYYDARDGVRGAIAAEVAFLESLRGGGAKDGPATPKTRYIRFSRNTAPADNKLLDFIRSWNCAYLKMVDGVAVAAVGLDVSMMSVFLAPGEGALWTDCDEAEWQRAIATVRKHHEDVAGWAAEVLGQSAL